MEQTFRTIILDFDLFLHQLLQILCRQSIIVQVEMGKAKAGTIKPTPGGARRFTPEISKKIPHKWRDVYRRFCRQRYETLLMKFPRIRDSDRVQKVVKEWSCLTEAQIKEIEKKQAEFAGFELWSSSSRKSQKASVQKVEKVIISAQAPRKLKRPPSPKVKVFMEQDLRKRRYSEQNVKEVEIEVSDDSFDAEMQKKEHDARPRGTKLVCDPVMKDKIRMIDNNVRRIEMRKEQLRQQFFKYYWLRLSAEHTNWGPSKIRQIVRLLWRKRCAQKERQLKQKKRLSNCVFGRNKAPKVRSGYQMFKLVKMSEGRSLQWVKITWRALPSQCKTAWAQRGDPARAHKSLLLSQQERQYYRQFAPKKVAPANLRFMNRRYVQSEIEFDRQGNLTIVPKREVPAGYQAHVEFDDQENVQIIHKKKEEPAPVRNLLQEMKDDKDKLEDWLRKNFE